LILNHFHQKRLKISIKANDFQKHFLGCLSVTNINFTLRSVRGDNDHRDLTVKCFKSRIIIQKPEPEVQTNATGFSLLRNTRAKKAADRSSAIL
jgi:hypothetical protein